MEILNAELKKGEIFVEALLDGELRRKVYPKNTDEAGITAELQATEDKIKLDKLNKVKYLQEQEEDKEATNTITSLLSKTK